MKKILCRQLCSESQWDNFLCCMRPLVTFKTRFLTRECFHSALGKEHGHPYRSTRVSRSEIILMGRMLLKGKLFKWTIALPLIASCWIMNYSGALVFPELLEQMTTGRSDNRKYSQTGGGSVGLKSACQRGLLKGFTGVFTAACCLWWFLTTFSV